MQETPEGTPVGVDDPYEVAGRCDHLTDDGRCRFALERAGDDPAFAAERRADDYQCVVADDDYVWRDCPHYRWTTDGKECFRCGLPEVRLAHTDARPLVEEHHLSYGSRASVTGSRSGSESGSGSGSGSGPSTFDGDTAGNTAGDTAGVSHEITVALCRWCHTKVHRSFARVTDDASPDPEAIAAREERRTRELEEMGFQSARDRLDDE